MWPVGSFLTKSVMSLRTERSMKMGENKGEPRASRKADPGASRRENCCHPRGGALVQNIVAGCAPVPDHLRENEEEPMQVISPRCAGLDVHQKTVVVTALMTQEDGSVERDQRTFAPMTA